MSVMKKNKLRGKKFDKVVLDDLTKDAKEMDKHWFECKTPQNGEPTPTIHKFSISYKNRDGTICQQAQSITTGDRTKVYGHPSVDFKRIAELWSAYLGKTITAEQVAICQILVKVGRLSHSPGHWDSIVDIAGYANCTGMLQDGAVVK